MQIETTQTLTVRLTGLEALDPVTVLLQNDEPGKGKITIECYGQAWSSFWNAMSGRTVEEFFVDCDEHYLAKNLSPGTPGDRFCGEALCKMARTTVIERRRGRSLDFDDLDAPEARELYDRCAELQEHETLESLPHDLMAELFGNEWWYAADKATRPNEHYEYLCRIIRAVQAGLQEVILQRTESPRDATGDQACNDTTSALPTSLPDASVVTDDMIGAALCSTASDDEGEFSCLADLLDFSGEDKARTVVRAALEAALLAAPAVPRPRSTDEVGRLGDMGPATCLRVGFDADNDVYVAVCDEDGMAGVEFCTPGAGGGNSPETRKALIALMAAIERDNEQDADRDWHRQHEGGR